MSFSSFGLYFIHFQRKRNLLFLTALGLAMAYVSLFELFFYLLCCCRSCWNEDDDHLACGYIFIVVFSVNFFFGHILVLYACCAFGVDFMSSQVHNIMCVHTHVFCFCLTRNTLHIRMRSKELANVCLTSDSFTEHINAF